MKAFGSRRTYARCIVVRAYDGAARKIKQHVKTHKFGRKWKLEV